MFVLGRCKCSSVWCFALVNTSCPLPAAYPPLFRKPFVSCSFLRCARNYHFSLALLDYCDLIRVAHHPIKQVDRQLKFPLGSVRYPRVVLDASDTDVSNSRRSTLCTGGASDTIRTYRFVRYVLLSLVSSVFHVLNSAESCMAASIGL